MAGNGTDGYEEAIDDYEEDVNPCDGMVRPDEQEKDKVAAYEVKVKTLRKEYLELRGTKDASALGLVVAERLSDEPREKCPFSYQYVQYVFELAKFSPSSLLYSRSLERVEI
ncbi:MAG: hypothetical protein M1840_007687 [Geoglossum simile]|nr:MAG: hypothetical protein M1840_007687 [Geoglossum simile]